MKKKFFLLPFLLITWILNSGFISKPNIKAVFCGDIAESVLQSDREILKDQPWIFDSKSGQIYAYDHNNGTLKPIKEEISGGTEITYINSYVRDNKLYIHFLERSDPNTKWEEEAEVKAILDFNKKTIELTYYEGDLDFNNMELTDFTGNGPGENVCREITIPKNIQILI